MAIETVIEAEPARDWLRHLTMRRREAEARRLEACLARGLLSHALNTVIWTLAPAGLWALSWWLAFHSNPHFDGSRVAIAIIPIAVFLGLLVAATSWLSIPRATRHLRNPSEMWVPREVVYLLQLVILPQFLAPLTFSTAPASWLADLDTVLIMLGITSFVLSIWCAVISVKSNMNCPLRWSQRLLLGFWACSLVGMGIASGAFIWLGVGYRCQLNML